MGIPKFFRWISERYPCLNELVSEHQIPEFDNLYLDMNGIIHVCSHPNDFDPHFRISEEKIFKDIFAYIETLFCIIKPQKLFFMAVDGVAPRAKMNQQRGRRFRSAKEAEVLEEAARKKGEELPPERRFDSNCITPGTEFMVKLQQQLKYFVAYKMTNDKLWQRPRIILSGHETPGEGEHKIMDYIRYLKSSPSYNPVTRHCLYGLDADLIMLGLCSHEPHFSLLREEVKFGKKQQKRMSSPAATKFYLLHLSLMREYLDLEFSALKGKLRFPYDIDCIINDWVLMCFLVGNDFIPNLPGLHISSGALPVLYEAYMDVMPKLGGYINEYGYLHLERFQTYMERLSLYDHEQFKDIYADLKYFENKTGRRPGQNRKQLEPFEEFSSGAGNLDLEALIKSTDDMLLESSDGDEDLSEVFNMEEDSDEGEELVRLEFMQHKKDYYMNKLEYSRVTAAVLQSQAEGYVRAIQWNLHYYYHGVCSWSWFYPHHYAPFISDIRDFTKISLEFELAEPFLPFQQLLAVLPSASKELLPAAYHGLMVDHSSPIKHYYPHDFETDLNGKRQEWEALVLIPFIDQAELLTAMAMCEDKLTPTEKLRNCHGPMLQYDYQPTCVGIFEGTEFFPPIKANHALITNVDRRNIEVPRSKLVKGLCPNYNPELYIPGFPSLRHIPHKASLQNAKVRVFERPSQLETLVIQLLKQEHCELSLTQVADKLLGKIVFVSYPHLIEARVVSVCNKRMKIMEANNNETKMEEFTNSNTNPFLAERKNISELHSTRLAIDIGETNTIVFAHTLVGRKYVFTPQGKVTLEKQWSTAPSAFALQAIVEEVTIPTPEYTQYNSVSEVFTTGSVCFIINTPNYGSKCEVIACDSVKPSIVHVKAFKTMEPDLSKLHELYKQKQELFNPSAVAAQYVGISSYLFSSITGAIFIFSESKGELKKVNIGLNLKFNSRNEEVPGYTRKRDGVWLYSSKTIDLVAAYLAKFPKLFRIINQRSGSNRGNFQEEDLFPTNGKESLSDVILWLKQQPYYKLEHQKCGIKTLDEEDIEGLESTIANWSAPLPETMPLQVPAQYLYKPGTMFGNLSIDPSCPYEVFDRVLNIRENFIVPIALKGTVLSVHPTEDQILVLFDNEFEGAIELMGCSSKRCYNMSKTALLNLSYGLEVGKRSSRPKSAFVLCGSRVQGGINPKPKDSSFGPSRVDPGPSADTFDTMWESLKAKLPTGDQGLEKPPAFTNAATRAQSMPGISPRDDLQSSTLALKQALGMMVNQQGSSVNHHQDSKVAAQGNTQNLHLQGAHIGMTPEADKAVSLQQAAAMAPSNFNILIKEQGHQVEDVSVIQLPNQQFRSHVLVQGHGCLHGPKAASREMAVEKSATTVLKGLKREDFKIPQQHQLPPPAQLPSPTQLPSPPQQWVDRRSSAWPNVMPGQIPWVRPPPFTRPPHLSGPPPPFPRAAAPYKPAFVHRQVEYSGDASLANVKQAPRDRAPYCQQKGQPQPVKQGSSKAVPVSAPMFIPHSVVMKNTKGSGQYNPQSSVTPKGPTPLPAVHMEPNELPSRIETTTSQPTFDTPQETPPAQPPNPVRESRLAIRFPIPMTPDN